MWKPLLHRKELKEVVGVHSSVWKPLLRSPAFRSPAFGSVLCRVDLHLREAGGAIDLRKIPRQEPAPHLIIEVNIVSDFWDFKENEIIFSKTWYHGN